MIPRFVIEFYDGPTIQQTEKKTTKEQHSSKSWKYFQSTFKNHEIKMYLYGQQRSNLHQPLIRTF